MAIGLGVIGWTPETFWSATITEFNAAIAGWNRAHGVPANDAMSRDELEDFMKDYPDE